MKYYTIKRWTGPNVSDRATKPSEAQNVKDATVNRSGRVRRILYAPPLFLMKEYGLSERVAKSIVVSIFLVAGAYITLSMY